MRDDSKHLRRETLRLKRSSLMHYAQAFFIQATQTAACNRLHSLGEHLAWWMLMCQDRTQSDLLPITHEVMIIMLGVEKVKVSHEKGEAVIQYDDQKVTEAKLREGINGWLRN